MTADPVAARLRAELLAGPEPDVVSGAAVQARVDDILRPPGALARLDDVAVFLAKWQGTATPDVQRPAVLIFAADHGVAADGVSAYPVDVTAAMVGAIDAGKASISALAAASGATVTAVDVGVGNPTANLRTEPAMSAAAVAEAFAAGRAAVAQLADQPSGSPDVLIVGEVGIGNTTAAAVITASIIGGDPATYVGAGTGVDSTPSGQKAIVVAEAVARITEAGVSSDPWEVLRHGGGRELAAMAGAMVESRLRSIPLLLDGYITSAAALVVHELDPGFTEHMIAATRSAEPGHTAILDRLNRQPLLDLELRLGEGSGAATALPLLRLACAAVTNVATFTEWFGQS